MVTGDLRGISGGFGKLQGTSRWSWGASGGLRGFSVAPMDFLGLKQRFRGYLVVSGAFQGLQGVPEGDVLPAVAGVQHGMESKRGKLT